MILATGNVSGLDSQTTVKIMQYPDGSLHKSIKHGNVCVVCVEAVCP